MRNGYRPQTELLLAESAIDQYAVNGLGVSPDFLLVTPLPYRVCALGMALADRPGGIMLQPDNRTTADRYHELLAADKLRGDMRTFQGFLKRHVEIVGTDNQSFLSGELLAAVKQNRHRWPADRQQQFERGIAHVHSLVYERAISRRELHYIPSTFCVESDRYGSTLATGDNLYAQLPQTPHAGIVQCLPGARDVFTRFSEVTRGKWRNAALLSNGAYSEEFSQTVGQELFGVPAERIFTTDQGIDAGTQELLALKDRHESLRDGFGAMIISGANSVGGQIAGAIRHAPDLLTPNGVLVMSDADISPDGQGSMADLIECAREVFNDDYESIAVMTTDENDTPVGHQVVFRKNY